MAPPIPARAPAPPPPDPQEERKKRAWAALEPVGEGRALYIDRDTAMVGRASPADGIVPEVDLGDQDHAGTVSRRHARLVRGADEVLLEDLGSSNGTFVNGERILPGVQKPIFEKDEVRFGALRFQFHWRKKARG